MGGFTHGKFESAIDKFTTDSLSYDFLWFFNVYSPIELVAY